MLHRVFKAQKNPQHTQLSPGSEVQTAGPATCNSFLQQEQEQEQKLKLIGHLTFSTYRFAT